MTPTLPTGPRVILLTDQISTLRGRAVLPSIPSWPPKDPSETLTYTAAFDPLMVPGTPVQLDYAVSPAGALRIVASYSGTTVQLTISGGTVGTTPQIAMTLTLDNGQQVTRSATLPIQSLGPVAAIEPDALTINGFALQTDGDPITT